MYFELHCTLCNDYVTLQYIKKNLQVFLPKKNYARLLRHFSLKNLSNYSTVLLMLSY